MLLVGRQKGNPTSTTIPKSGQNYTQAPEEWAS